LKDISSIINNYKDYEDKLLVKNIISFCETCENEYSIIYTDFLDPRQQSIVLSICKLFKDIKYGFDGGIDGAERQICYISSSDYDSEPKIPIELLKLSWKSEKKLKHRDFLGSLIHSGLKREKIGDMVVQDNYSYIAAHKDIAEYILYNLSKVGNTSILVRQCEEAIQIENNTKYVSSTVSSLRLDCIISAGFGISRSEAMEQIKASKVYINWESESSSSSTVSKGDTVTLRGKGRVILEDVGGTTKKDRIKILIKKFV